ncbi:MAG TPA: hypothetical protein DIC36_08405 [Gammaproteobacteria bacterium]|nr:hypothetical protein [Gammaproteobacteria bacterium]
MYRNNSFRVVLAAVAAAGLVSMETMAGETLNSKQIKEMFADKTIDAVNHVQGGKSQLTYFSADGKIAQKAPSGEKREGSWRVSDKNQQCITWSGQKEVCSSLQARGDGTYDRIVGDKAVVTIQKMRDGNLLDK